MEESDGIVLKSTLQQKEVSLQDAFEKFRRKKSEEIRLQLLMTEKKKEEILSRTDEQKNSLRMKFIDNAKKYLGVPYHQKYRAPDAELSPLYLDCCGLVRQCVRDLKEDFGFMIANWNQAYQIDVLPKVITNASDLVPGDLVFYEGNFKSNRSKKQKHDIVHVEIFIGGETGEATIGARFQTGVIQVFPSYKFESSKWSLVNHHFRSLDPWLDGVCKSCCPEHAWESFDIGNALASGRRSIFSMSEDEPAEDDEEPQHESLANYDNDHIDNGNDNGNGLLPPSHHTSEEKEHHQQHPVDPSSSLSLPSSTGEMADSVIGKTSCSKPAAGKLIPKPPGRRRTVTESSPSPAAAAPVLVPGDASRRGIKSGISRRSASSSPKPPLSYYVGKSNGWRLVKAALDKRGWHQLPFDYSFSSKFSFKWVERRSQIDFRAHTAGQLVNHIPNNDVLTTKMGLLDTMRSFYCNNSPRGHTSDELVSIPPWLPETYELDMPADRLALIRSEEQRRAVTGVDGMWMYKPTSSNRGRGLKVLRGKDALVEACDAAAASGKSISSGDNTQLASPTKAMCPAGSGSAGIIQRYIERALLVDGYKFDIRCYLLVARTYPKFIGYYHAGYCRLTLERYDSNQSNANAAASDEDLFLHLTNASVQKKHPLYQTRKETQIQSPEAIADIMEKCGDVAGAEFIRHHLDNMIKKCMVDVLKAAVSKLHRKHGYFDLFGLDFMVDVDSDGKHRLLLLEANTNPALSLDNSTLEKIIPGVVDGAIELVLRAQGPDSDPTAPASVPVGSSDNQAIAATGFELIFDESTGFQFKD
eukprot:gene88-116_t